jgi:hypothetical protein
LISQPLQTYGTPCAPRMRGEERHEFFNFPSEQPSLKREQMLPFYAFVGKLCTFLESVAARLHLIWLEFLARALGGDDAPIEA